MILSAVYEEFKAVSRLYAESGGLHGTGTGRNKKRAVIFAVIIGGNDTIAAFEQLGVDDAPNILVSTPKMTSLDSARLYMSECLGLSELGSNI